MPEVDIEELTAVKRARIAKYLQQRTQIKQEAVDAIPQRNSNGPAPLSFGQQQLWLHAQMVPDIPVYNECQTIYLPGSLNVRALEQSVNEFIRRHEIWRTTFPLVDGQPIQVVQPYASIALPFVDLRTLPGEVREREALRRATEDAIRPFDLEQGPLLRFLLVRMDDEDHRLFITEHHIIFDAVAIYQVFLPELWELYTAFVAGMPSPLPALPIQYADYAVWQRKMLEDRVLSEHLAYWKRQLAGAPRLLDLPTDRPRPRTQSYRGSMLTFALSKPLTEAIKKLCQQEGVTPYICLVAAFQVLLYRYTGQEDLLIGTVTAGRKHPDVQKLMGYFLNTLVLRTNMAGNPPFRQLLRRVRDINLSALAHEDVPFELVVKELRPEREVNHTPLVQVLMSYQPPLPALASNWSLSQMDVQSYTAKFDLSIELDDRAEGLIGRFIYNTDLFDETTVRRMFKHWQMLLAGIIANPMQCLAALPLLTEAERHTALMEWNTIGTTSIAVPCVHQMFEAQVERTPDALALVLEESYLTYSELNCRANQMAHTLQNLGVGPEVLVGLCVERSLEMVVGILAILKAGGVYLPLATDTPAERLAFLLHDAQPSVLLTRQSLLASFPSYDGHIVCIEEVCQTSYAHKQGRNPVSEVSGEHLAYVIYTSGSTGTPKGVGISHLALAEHCHSIQQKYSLQAEDRVLQFSTFTFDASLEQILPTLTVGAQLVLRGPAVWSAMELYERIQQGELTVVNFPPAYWQHVVREWTDATPLLPCQGLRLIIVGGDRLTPESLALWARTPLYLARLLNAYGPTETTITATLFEIDPCASEDACCRGIPIGCPISNRTAYVLDGHGSPVPVGVPGELHIGGSLLARGYLKRPELTGERFVPDPFSNSPGARLYKTGDLVRYRPDGNIEFLGRVDQQVKLRGFRIELGEIEATLSHHPSIQEAVVVVREDATGEKHLVAYVVPQQGCSSASSLAAFRQYLQTKLPSYMVPSTFVLIDAVPLTQSGKVDRNALPVPEHDRKAEVGAYVAPTSLMQHQLVHIWQDLLGRQSIGLRDNFFDLGGHSLLAARLISQIKQTFGKELSLSTLFAGPTVEHLAEAILQQQHGASRAPLLAVQASGSQRPFFFLHGDWTGGAFYCFSLARALGTEQPFYVLEPYKFAGLKVLPTFEAMAAAHLESLRAIQPAGPYLLGGFCNGGLVAYEMARQLCAMDEQVDLLLLINPTSPVPLKKLSHLTHLFGNLLGRGKYAQAADFLRVRHALRHVYRYLYPADSRLEDFARLVEIDPHLDAMFPPLASLYRDYVAAFTWLAANYDPGWYPGKITFFWARDELFIKDDWLPLMKAKASEEIEEYIVSGTHMSCVTEHAQEVAEQLWLCVSQIQQMG